MEKKPVPTDSGPQTAPKSPKKPAQSREDRLKAALKSNLGRRKQLARARATSDETEQKSE